MPGSPPASPNFGSPRYADSDDATFSEYQLQSLTRSTRSLCVTTTRD